MQIVLAAVSAADIAVLVLLGLGLLGGAIGGLARAFKGIFATVAIMLVSLLLAGVLLTPVQNGLGGGLESKLKGTAEGWGQAFTLPVYILRDNEGEPIKDGDGNLTFYLQTEDGAVMLADAAGSGLVNKAKGKLAVKLAKRFVKDRDDEGKPLSDVAGAYLTSIILEIALFVVLCVALGVIFFLLRKLFGRMHKSDSGGIKIIDRTLGAVMSAAMAFLFVLVVLAIIRVAAKTGGSVDSYMTASKITGYLYLNNPMAPLLTKIFG